MTQLAKEFLRIQGFVVDINTKIPKKGRGNKSTDSDVDIIAYRYKTEALEPETEDCFKTFKLNNCVVGEVKSFDAYKGTVKEVRDHKFGKWNGKNIKHRINYNVNDRVLFCRNASKTAKEFAENNDIKIITAAEIINAMGYRITNKHKKRHTYDPELPIYSALRDVMYFLSENQGKKRKKSNEMLSDKIFNDLLLDKKGFLKKNSKELWDLIYSSNMMWEIIFNEMAKKSEDRRWLAGKVLNLLNNKEDIDWFIHLRSGGIIKAIKLQIKHGRQTQM